MFPAPFRATLLVLAAVVVATPATAQLPTPDAAAAGKVLDAEALKGWKTIRATALSHDGAWFAYLISPNEGNAEVVIRPTGAGSERQFAVGELPSGGGVGAGLQLSGDGKWLAYLAYPTADEAKRLRTARRPVQSRAVVVNVATGESREFEKIRRVAFGGDQPRWLAMQGYAPESGGGAGASGGSGAGGGAGAAQASSASSGTDLLLHQLGSTTVVNIGNVADFSFDDSGDWLAMAIDARDRLGNGIHLRNLRTDLTRVLESDAALYRRMQWADSGLALAALRATIDSAGRDTTWAVLGFANAGAASPARTIVTGASGVPEGLAISSTRTPTWARDHSALYFGLAEKPASAGQRPDVRPVAGTPGAMQRPAPAGGEDELPTLVIWHGREPRLQSLQQVQESQDRNFSYLASFRIRENRVVQLATDSVRSVSVAPGDRWAIGNDSRAYEHENGTAGGNRRDVWVIDAITGTRRLALREQRFLALPSPDGNQLLYWNDGHYHVQEMATGASRNITAGLPVSFVNVEDDHNVDRPPVNPIGWAKGSASVLLSDGWDVWQVPVRTGRAVNLTADGRREGIRYRQRLVWDPKERGIDLAQPLFLHAYGEWTKREGIARVAPGRPGAERYLWGDAKVQVSRARDAERFVWTRQTFTEFPDYWAAGAGFQSPNRLTEANPQQREYAWSPGARLVNYVSDKGDSLQAALFLPAGYREGQAYPTTVYIYEKLSQSLHQYATPNETRALNPSVYTSKGIAVLMPDIVYKLNDPGMSAVWTVLPAVRAAAATGIVDITKVGLHGHSWGGYQTAFLVTQTDMFASAVAGAALTDMVSMYSSVYWNSGNTNQGIFESSQGRFLGNFIENYDAYIRNSPAFHADKVTTPLLLLHNEKDGAVDFNQGITYFNTLRQLGKEVILLQYVGENHGLSLPRNQKDYAVRMGEWFGHYLLGQEAPDWMREGIPRLKMEEHLKARQQAAKPALVP